MSMRERFASVTSRLLREDPHPAVVLADIGVAQFWRAMRRHPDRVINVGIREQLLIGVASGLALAGMRPIAHSYAPFLVQRPFEQIKLDLAHQGVGAVLVSIGASYDASGEGRTHQAPEDVAMLATLPGWEIHVPGHPDEAELLLRHAVAGDGNVYLRLSSRSNTAAQPVEPGRFNVVRRGSQGVVVAVGPMLDPVLDAAGDLDLTVLYAATVLPFDVETLRSAAHVEQPNVVLVEPYLQGTSASRVSEALRELPHRLLSIGVQRAEHRRYGAPEEHDVANCLDPASLRQRIGQFLGAGALEHGSTIAASGRGRPTGLANARSRPSPGAGLTGERAAHRP
jgi:transketolase